MASYIPDGWTRDGYIAAAVTEESGERLYDELEFSYRPSTRLDNIKIDAEIDIALKTKDFDPQAAVKAELIACKFVSDRLVSWTLKNGAHPIGNTPENCGRLHPYLFNHLYRIIRGLQVSDKKPDQEDPPKSDEEMRKNSETVSG